VRWMAWKKAGDKVLTSYRNILFTNKQNFMAIVKNQPAKTVEQYLKEIKPEHRVLLEKIREAIKAAAPNAEELISYQIPTFKYNGPVAAYASFKNHCSYFTTSYGVMELFAKELKPFKTSGVTIQFTPENPLPDSLVKKMVKAKIKENNARMAKKKNAKKTV
jgi:uncharacterized protein YdhG (YjbR/CyaY superfamily)